MGFYPLGAFDLRSHQARDHVSVLLQRHRIDIVASRALNDRANCEDEFEHRRLSETELTFEARHASRLSNPMQKGLR